MDGRKGGGPYYSPGQDGRRYYFVLPFLSISFLLYGGASCGAPDAQQYKTVQVYEPLMKQTRDTNKSLLIQDDFSL